MAKQSVEDIKKESRGLRGKIVETINSGADHFEDAEYQLMKFHGSYQQDDRDVRSERRKQKLDKAWSFMIRSKMPGGRLSPEQYVAHDNIADSVGCGNMRLTTRQGIQLHGVLIGNLQTVIKTVVDSGLTTSGACGDVVRNTMGPASPIKDSVHADCQKLTEELTQTFLATTKAYYDIWLDGEKLPMTEGDPSEDPEDPIYGKEYLPRKFKIGIAVPPRNDVDIFTNDIGMVPHVVDGEVAGYSIWIGGGFGMTHGMEVTRPHLAKPLAYAERGDVIDVVKAIVQVQKENGNRENRKLARLKHVVMDNGIPWFLGEVRKIVGDGVALEDVKEVTFDTVGDQLGWHEQGDGNYFRGVHVPQGRVENIEGGALYKNAFRLLAEKMGLSSIVTPNCNMIFSDISESQRAEVDKILADHNIPGGEDFSTMRQMAHACVALPTCGLALSESERVLGGLLDSVDDILNDLDLEEEQLLVRMTGCPNGCARPYNADFAFVGRGPNKYAMYVGGSHRGDRLAGLYKKVVMFDDIPAEMREILEDFVKNREAGETFTDFWGRTRQAGEEPDSSHFHVELEERAAAQAAAKA